MAFGGFGKAIGGAFKGAGKNIKGAFGGGAGVNAGPSGGFMSRFKSAAPMALNNAAQMWGGDMKNAARMTGSMNMRRPQGPTGEVAPPPMEGGGINTGPSPMSGIMPGAAGQMSGLFGGSGFLPPGLADKMGGNTGISGGMFNRPRLDPNTGQYGPPSPMGGGMGSIFSRIYGNMGQGDSPFGQPNRPQIFY